MKTTEKEYVGWAEQAKMIKKVLKGRWPAVKFSVRSKSYSGGASVSIHWVDGPSTKSVDEVSHMYEGSDFDGMQDLKTGKDTILVGPNGMRRVHFLGDFVFSSRSITDFDSLAKQAEEMIRAKCKIGDQWVDQLARNMVWSLNFDKQETLETAFRRIVLRENI